MRCFVVTKKHIAAAFCTVVAVSSVIILSCTKESGETVTAFNHESSDEIMADVLPTAKESSVISQIKDFISSSVKRQPGDIINSFGGVFSGEHTYYPEPSATPEATTVPTQTPTEQRTTRSNQIFKNDTNYVISNEILTRKAVDFPSDTEVLIIHTHTTESYTPEEPTGLPDNSRSTDESKNMIAIGEIIKAELEKTGIKVIHDKTVHDYPSYQGAYGRSLTTASKHTGANDKIRIVLDIHRDAIVNNDGARVKLIKDINGVCCAQMMIVCGTDDGGLSHPNWQNNLNFALTIQEAMEKKYPELMRPINLRKERFNQHLTPGSLILEIGTHGNTITEAKNGALLLAQTIGEILTDG